MWTQTDFWTWVSGANTADQLGSYGTKGVAAAGNRPGARQYSATWTDSSGQLWLFGGESSASSSSTYYFNDLWKFNGTYWTWVSGASIVNQFGTYGTKGVAAATNIPGARYGAVSWIDNSGNFWLFGGEGYDSTGAYGPYGLLNDLWKFDGTNWTWVSGANTANQIGTYGTKGVAAATNIPGAREGAVSWIDGSGQLWLFGGYGYDSAGSGNVLNDLWKFDGTNWIWVSGSNTSGQIGTYGTKGVAAATNVPGARDRAVSWIDRYGALWLFGGNGHDSTSSYGYLNDLWVFTVNGNYWIWKGGANTMNQTGTYGTKGVADAANIPGGRESAVSWTDSSGHFWLFSGHGYDSFNLNLSLNDLWKFDGTNWTWVSGASTGGQSGNYGTKGVADIANVPSGRYSAVSWTDGSGHFWLFGGWGKDGTGGFGYLNDLWSYQP
jgi:N-acetylneuraminic acid mutarotase